MTKFQHVFLDIDSTIIYATPSSEYVKKSIADKLEHFTWQNFTIYKRPYLDNFLDFLFANFEVSIWTAASKDYAEKIVKKYVMNKPGRTLKYFLSEVDTKYFLNKFQRMKPLNELAKLTKEDSRKWIIIDDNVDVWNSNPFNCYQILEFKANDRAPEDVEFFYLAKFLAQN